MRYNKAIPKPKEIAKNLGEKYITTKIPTEYFNSIMYCTLLKMFKAWVNQKDVKFKIIDDFIQVNINTTIVEVSDNYKDKKYSNKDVVKTIIPFQAKIKYINHPKYILSIIEDITGLNLINNGT